MTDPNHAASIDAELTLKILLGPQIIAYRPAARTESGSDWKLIDEDTDIGIATDSPCNLRVRLVAYDTADEVIPDPAWRVRASTQPAGGSWQLLSDRCASVSDYLTDALEVADEPRAYRFQIALSGTTLMATFDLSVQRTSDDDHDIIYDPDGDLKPPAGPLGGTTDRSSVDRLTASG